ALPTGGGSLIVAAGEITLVAADLYMVGELANKHGTLRSLANTAIDPTRALLAEVPEATDLVLALIAVPIGASGAVRALHEARLATRSIRSLREALHRAAGDLAHPEVVATTREVR